MMRQTETNISIVSGNIFSDSLTEANGVNLSEVSIGTTRFQILRTRPPEGFKCVHGRPEKIQNTTRLHNISPEAWRQISQDQKRKIICRMEKKEGSTLQTTGRNRRTYEVSVDDKDCLMVIAQARLKTEKENAVVMPCLLREDSRRNLRVCATFMEASSGTPEADNDRAYDRKLLGYTSEHKRYVHRGQVHKPIAIQEGMRIPDAKVGVNKERAKFCTRRRELQSVYCHMTEKTVLGFSGLETKSPNKIKKQKSPSERCPCIYFKQKKFCFVTS